MPVSPPNTQLNVYRNPVHARACPDPFVLKHAGEYWCYCTGLRPDGGAFGILHSTDLVSWREAGSALQPLPGGHTCYWAPEVTYHAGRFYMYYSVGNETRMAIRVAVAEHPAGPFVDSGRTLTAEEFAIDAHVLTDEDGQRYLFYATDYLEHSHVGTGIAADRLVDPFQVAGQPQPVARARFAWQVYDPARREKGGVRWHTVEGPFVLKRKGRYYLLFSGGNWQNTSYGVGYAVSDTVLPESEWSQMTDGENTLPILRTLTEAGIIGPGHNSVVRGPDNQQLYCVYHRWSPEINDRVLAVDRLEWVGDRLLVIGPTHTSQPGPNGPRVCGFGADGRLGAEWEAARGEWQVTGRRLRQARADGHARASRLAPGPQFIAEVTAAGIAGGEGRGAAVGVSLLDETGDEVLRVTLPAATLSSDHLVRVEADGDRARARLDGGPWQQASRAGPVSRLALFTHEASASFAGLQITAGWQDDFHETAEAPEALGWRAAGGGGAWTIAAGELLQTDPSARGSLLVKGTPLPAYEVVVNGRLCEYGAPGPGPGGWGLCPSYASLNDTGPLFTVEPHRDRWNLVWRPGRAPNELEKQDTVWVRGHVFPLPGDFDPYAYQQFRFRIHAGQLAIQWAGQHLGGIQAPARPGALAVYTDRAAAAWEMVRVTGL